MKNKVIILSLFAVSIIMMSCNSTKPVIVGEHENNTEAKKQEAEKEKLEKERATRHPEKMNTINTKRFEIK